MVWSTLQSLLSTEGMQAFRMKSFYRFFMIWGVITLGLIYLLLLLPIKFTANASLHAKDASIVLGNLHFAMWHDDLKISSERQWQGKVRRTPRKMEEAVDYMVQVFKTQEHPWLSSASEATRISSTNERASFSVCGGTLRCFKTTMSERHSGILAIDIPKNQLIYDADGTSQTFREKCLTALNVMTLFPLIDEKPFVFQILGDGKLIKEQRTSYSNRLRSNHKLYGVIPLFESQDLSLPSHQPFLLPSFL
jgi:hypothetical protein